MVYGGLRGAVGLVMGLIVEHNPYVRREVAQMVAFHCSGIVLLTLLINGTTIDGLYRRLKLYPVNQYRMTHLRKTLYKLETDCQKAGIRKLIKDWFFHDCHFKKLLRCVPNFSNIRFDATGIPHPDKLEPVKKTLQCLSEEAANFRMDHILERMDSFQDSFIHQWRR